MQINQINKPIDIGIKEKTVYVAVHGDVAEYSSEEDLRQIENFVQQGARQIHFMNDDLGVWDSSLVLLVYETVRIAKNAKIEADLSELPVNLRDLVNMAFEVDRKPQQKEANCNGILECIGRNVVNIFGAVSNTLNFFGEVTLAVLRCLTFRSIMRRVVRHWKIAAQRHWGLCRLSVFWSV